MSIDSQIKSQRIYEFDIIKGYLVLYVLIIHLLKNYLVLFKLDVFFEWLLPLFFWISAYYMEYKPLKVQMKKRLFSIIRPLFMYFLIYTLIVGGWNILDKTLTFEELGRSILSEILGKPFLNLFDKNLYIKTELHTPLTTFWFYIQYIIAVIFALPILNFINDSIKRGMFIIIILLALSCFGYYLNIEFPFYLNMTAYVIAIMILGRIEGDMLLREKLYKLNIRQQIIVFLISLFIATSVCYLNQGLSFMSHGKIGSYGIMDPITAFIEVFAGSISMMLVAKFTVKGTSNNSVIHGLPSIEPLKVRIFKNEFLKCSLIRGSLNLKIIKKIIFYFGENMFDIVLLHMFIGWFLYKVFHFPIAKDYFSSGLYTGELWQHIMITGIFLINITICFMIIKIKNKIRITRRKK